MSLSRRGWEPLEVLSSASRHVPFNAQVGASGGEYIRGRDRGDVLSVIDGFSRAQGVAQVCRGVGQPLRLALEQPGEAAGIVSRPRLLILDEPSNHLDAEAVSGLLAALEGLTPVPAILLITHEPRLSAWADRVVELSDGRVVEDARSL